MWIVRLALRRPYTFVVAALMIVIMGVVTIAGMTKDIFPDINIPVASVVWTYSGVSPDEMEKRIVTVSERAFTTTVNDIEHMESQSMTGVSVIKIFFQPNAKIEAAVAQLTAVSQTVIRVMPPGITPPLILRYSATNVPILQMGVGSKTLSEQELFDLGLNFIRTQLATVQGASIPLPYGGKPRLITVDLDPQALFAKNLSATDVVNAVNAQNLILPAGDAKIGDRDYTVALNNSPEAIEALNDLPIKIVNGAMVYVRDVAYVHDGFSVQTNIVRQDGQRSTLLTILKNGSASTLDVVERVKQVLPRIKSTLPAALDLKLLFDQSLFVKASLDGVIKEAVIAACLTATMILLFLGSWRSTVIVAVSIPLSILCSIMIMNLLGQTLNIMTLGGLALAVGILVDDATVEIENIHRNLTQGKPITRAILDGAEQIATPALVATFCICIVFTPVVFLGGVAKFLFTPLAMAVVFAMLSSYVLSRTLVPVMAQYLLASEVDAYQENGHHVPQNPIWRLHHSFNHQFERMRAQYRQALAWGLGNRIWVLFVAIAFLVSGLALVPYVGQDFFPQVDAGQFRLHVRAPAGTRIEETERLFNQVENAIRRTIPSQEISTILDNIGLPNSGINLAFGDSATIGPADGEILVALTPEEHGSTWQYIKELRQKLKAEFPQLSFFFQPADIVSQILNFGLPAPVDIQVLGRNATANYQIAKQIIAQVALIPGTVDVHLHQVIDAPELGIDVDRTEAEQAGFTQRDVANDVLTSLSSSSQTTPNYWLNPKNGVNYSVAVQIPTEKINSLADLESTPVNNGSGTSLLLSNLATVKRRTNVAVVNHYNVQPVFDIYANVQDRDLGSVSQEIDRIVAKFRSQLPKGSFIEVRGQVGTMKTSFISLGIGLVFAILLVYFLMVVNFQSWLDPLIIIMALPSALSGIIWMLYVTQTTFSVPSLMGAIMSIGVATANSILLVTFANDQRTLGKEAREAALLAGYTRLRPVLMTALAMIIGMVPMSLGLGEGGEQNAPLGRAVIGGLSAATLATLFFVPVVYSKLRYKQPQRLDAPELEEKMLVGSR
jgi:multidrug efflux pump subunit AcrB